MKKKIPVLLALAVLLLATVAVAAAAAPSSNSIEAHLKPVNGSGIHGLVNLRQLSKGGTSIDVVAKGLKPGSKHLSLYYSNHVCALEPYSKNDVIGGHRYTADQKGVGRTSGDADDDLDEINSVSVRAADFTLQACADVHPS